jgi:hypothetical protein
MTTTTYPKVPVWRTAYEAYRLGLAAVLGNRVLLRFLVCAAVPTTAVLAAEFYLSVALPWLPPGAAASDPLSGYDAVGMTIPLLSLALLAVAQAPLGLAIQRRILLGDAPKGTYLSLATDRRGRRYVGISLLIAGFFYAAVLAEIVSMGIAVNDGAIAAGARARAGPILYTLLAVSVWAAVYVGACALSAKCAFMFPAVATDREGAWREFFGETRGNALRLFLLFAIVLTPPSIAGVGALAAAAFATMATLTAAEGLSDAAAEQAAMAMLASSPFLIAYAVAVAAYMTACVVTAAAAACAYRIVILRGLAGVEEAFA